MAEIDPKDAHVMLVAQEHAGDILATSNVEDFTVLTPACRVEPPSSFLRRWVCQPISYPPPRREGERAGTMECDAGTGIRLAMLWGMTFI